MQSIYLDIVKYQNECSENVKDEIAVEQFLQIFVNGEAYAIIMRLPGEDLDLVRGFCFTEGLIADLSEIEWLGHCPEEEGGNKVLVELIHAGSNKDENFSRAYSYVSRSSCGLCGKSSLDNIYLPQKKVENKTPCSVQTLINLTEDFNENIQLFPRTGYTHSAAIYSYECELLAFAEDVGRHNAVDKIVGKLLSNDTKKESFIGVVSSRLSFEMVQKAVSLGLEIFAGISAPSSLAVQVSQEYNTTLIGFMRSGRMNIYTVPERIKI